MKALKMLVAAVAVAAAIPAFATTGVQSAAVITSHSNAQSGGTSSAQAAGSTIVSPGYSYCCSYYSSYPQVTNTGGSASASNSGNAQSSTVAGARVDPLTGSVVTGTQSTASHNNTSNATATGNAAGAATGVSNAGAGSKISGGLKTSWSQFGGRY